MSSTWVIVANGSVARFFEIDGKGHLNEFTTLVHPESRLHGRDLTSDRPGRAYESTGTARHAIEQTTSPKEVELETFAHFISDHLAEAHNDKKFERLYIAASPRFLGILRRTIKPSMAKTLHSTIDKDMTQMTPSEIRAHLEY